MVCSKARHCRFPLTSSRMERRAKPVGTQGKGPKVPISRRSMPGARGAAVVHDGAGTPWGTPAHYPAAGGAFLFGGDAALHRSHTRPRARGGQNDPAVARRSTGTTHGEWEAKQAWGRPTAPVAAACWYPTFFAAPDWSVHQGSAPLGGITRPTGR